MNSCIRSLPEPITTSELTYQDILVVGHRGMGASKSIPENTAKSIEKALEIGVQGIEVDVQLTKDNQLILFHDSELNKKTNCKGTVAEMTLDELIECKYNRIDNCGVPLTSLDEVFQIIPDSILIFIDSKLSSEQVESQEFWDNYSMALDELLASHSNYEQVIVEVTPEIYANLNLSQNVKMNAVGSHPNSLIEFATNNNLYGIGTNFENLDEQLIAQAQENDLFVASWGAPSRSKNWKSAKLLPNAIQTDRPKYLLKLLEKN